MNNYPPGFSGGVDLVDDEVLHVCQSCGFERKIPMLYELGGWFYPEGMEDDTWCDECDTQMDIVERGK